MADDALMFGSLARKSALLTSLTLSAACTHAPADAPPRQAPAPAPAAVPSLPDAGWVRVEARSMATELRLPDAANWSAEPLDSWWRVVHEATNSVLEVKRWREGELARPADCEAQATLWRPELRRAELPLVEQRREFTNAGFERLVSVDVDTGADSRTVGRARAYGSRLRECLAVVFTTRAAGPAAPAAVARRLQLVSDRLLPSVTPLGVDERVERDRRR